MLEKEWDLVGVEVVRAGARGWGSGGWSGRWAEIGAAPSYQASETKARQQVSTQ